MNEETPPDSRATPPDAVGLRLRHRRRRRRPRPLLRHRPDPVPHRLRRARVHRRGRRARLSRSCSRSSRPTAAQRTSGSSKAVAVAGTVVLGCLLVTFLSPPLFVFGPGLLVLGLVGLAGVLLWRALGGSVSGDPGRTIGRIALAALIGVAVLGAAVGVGLAAALGGGVVIAILAVVTGLALIGTAFVGGARWLIIPALALVLPLGDRLGGRHQPRRRRRRPRLPPRDQRAAPRPLSARDRLADRRPARRRPPQGRDDEPERGRRARPGRAVRARPTPASPRTCEIGVGSSDVLDRGSDGVDVELRRTTAPAPAGRPTAAHRRRHRHGRDRGRARGLPARPVQPPRLGATSTARPAAAGGLRRRDEMRVTRLDRTSSSRGW